MAAATSFSELRARLDAAREEYQLALKAHSEAIEFRRGVPDPDGTQLVYQANQALRIAVERYREALKNFTDHVLNRHSDQYGDRCTTIPGTVQVLLVEDNVADVRLVQEVVAHRPLRVNVAVATNCIGALAILSNQQFTPNLVIADLSVLEFGGVELMKHCNRRGIPVVIFSGSENPAHEEEVLRLGAKQFVRKPAQLDEYADAVRKLVANWATRASSSGIGML